MLAKLLSGSGGAGPTYSDITVVTSGSAVGNTTATFGTSLLQNDVVFLTVGYNDVDWSPPSGYIQYAGGILTGAYGYACYYKVMGATPDTSINIGDGNDSSAFTYYALRGVQTTDPVIEVANTIGSATSNLNPPSVSVFAKCMVLAAGFTGNGASAVLTAGPSGYSGFIGIDAAGNSDTYIGTAYKTITTTGTEDPGAFTLSNTAAAYGSTSIVIRPFSASFTSIAPEFVASASTQNTSSGTSLVINKPTGTVDGDLMVAFVFGAGGSVSGGWTGPGTWTEVAETTSARPLDAVYYRVASSEGSSYTFTAGTSRTLAGTIVTYRYAAYDAIGAFSTQTTSPTLPTVTTSLAQSRLLGVVGYDAASSSPTIAAMNSLILDNDGTAPSYRISDQVIGKGPSGQRFTTTAGGNSNGILIALKPTRS